MLAQIARRGRAPYRALLDLLLPPRCVACRRAGEWFCAACRSGIQRIVPPWCERCGRPLQNEDCSHCMRFPLQLDGLRAAAFFEGTRRSAIHAFKFRHRRELAPILARLLDEHLCTYSLPVDVIVPVPLFPARERERGYNQAFLLAQELAMLQNIPLWYNGIERVRATQPQTDLDTRERHRNVRGAFSVRGSINGMHVLLVDDVCTTDATMEACSIALKGCGAESVWGLALTRGR